MTHNHNNLSETFDEVPLSGRWTRIVEFVRSTFRIVAGEHIHSGASQSAIPETAQGLGFSACDPGLHAAVKTHEELEARRRDEAMARKIGATLSPRDN